MTNLKRLSLAWLLLALLAPGAAHAGSAPDLGTAFEPRPRSQPIYGTAAQTKTVTLKADDGVDLFVETWLPAPKAGNSPPDRIPTILIMTPYVQKGVQRYTTRNLANVVEWFTSRGYAVAQHHVRGTGESGGCLEQTADAQIADAATVIEHLGRDAAWSNGKVGMYGHSYDAEAQLSVAGRGDPRKTKYLKAIVPSASVGGQYEYSNFDGVPYFAQAANSNFVYYLAQVSLAAPAGPHTPEKLDCTPELVEVSADTSGNMTAPWQRREYRPGAENIRAATLWVHGLADWNVQPIGVAAFFDRLPAKTPRKGVFGQWEHKYPDVHPGVQPEWARQDFLPMVTAWYDRYLKGLRTGVKKWPAVQVQATDGTWRAERGWPYAGGPAGQLALAPGGALGTDKPAGSTSFVEGPDEYTVPGTFATFESPVMTAPLHLTGQPVLDAWLTTTATDGHLAGKIEVVGPDGAVLTHAGANNQKLGTHGARSLQHLDPMPRGYFEQASPKPVAANTPIHVPMRFQPVDLVVPAGARLRLTVAGATDWSGHQTVPGAQGSRITLLHDCAHTSVLRFQMPDAKAPLLNVRETDEKDGALAEAPAAIGRRDGAGLATRPVCGRAPEWMPEFFGPAPKGR